MIKRSQHWLDEPHGRGRKRTIKNWMHHRAPQAGRPVADDSDPWLDTKPGARPHGGTIPSWSGAVDMAYAALDAPLQAFAGDTTDAKNSALWGMRCADRPGSWANWKAYGVVEGISPRLDMDEAGNVIGATWEGLWPGADLTIRHDGHKVTKLITIRERSAPTHYEFTLKIPGGHSVVQVGDTLSIRDEKGVERLHTMPTWAHDSATTAPTPDGHQWFTATLTRMADVRGLARYALDVRPEDLASAVLPLPIDPTTTLSGPASIEDATLSSVNVDKNYGTSTGWYSGGTLETVTRFQSALIPDGSIAACRFYCYLPGIPAVNAPIAMGRLPDADTWVEGTVNGAVQAGSACWNYAQYDTLAWSVGAGAIGYDPALSDPIVPINGQYNVWSLPTAWPTSWRTGVNNGFRSIKEAAPSLVFRSTEYGPPAPYLEIDYVLGGAAAIMLARRIHE